MPQVGEGGLTARSAINELPRVVEHERLPLLNSTLPPNHRVTVVDGQRTNKFALVLAEERRRERKRMASVSSAAPAESARPILM